MWRLANKKERQWNTKPGCRDSLSELIEEWEDDGIWCIAVSPDDQLAASGGEKGEIMIRVIQEGGRIRHSIQAGSGVHSLCFSQNGEKLACAVGNYPGETGAIHAYDVDSGELVLGPIEGTQPVTSIIWSLDGSQLFSVSLDRTIRCWNSDAGESIGEPWKGHTHWAWSLSLSPDGTKLASASYDRTVRFWDAQSGDPIGQPLQHDDVVHAVTFSPSGEFVASGGDDDKVCIWRVPWWDDSQKQAHNSFLDLPAVPAPKDCHQDEFDFLDLPTIHRPLISSYRPLPDSTTVPVGTRIQHFWRGLVSRHPSSTAQRAIALQPTGIQDRRFWKPSVRIPITEVAAGHARTQVAVASPVPTRKKNKDDKSRKRRKPQTHAGLSTAEAGPSSHAKPSGSASNTGPSNSQAGTSTSSNAAPAGRTSSFAQSTTSSDDSWDDMDCSEKWVDYLCFGPRENRERFRPWKEKSPEVMEAEEQAKKAKRKGKGKQKARRHRTPTVADPQNVVHPLPHLDPQDNSIKTLSLASPPVGKADPQRLISQLEEQNKQLRRQLDDAAATMRNVGVRNDGLGNKVGELGHSSHESDKPQGLRVLIEPSGSKSDAGLTPKFASTSSDIPPEGHLSSSTQSDSDSLQAEEQAQNEKERENRLNDPASNATQSQNIVHARDHHGPESQKDYVTTASAASPATDEVDVQRAILELQEQFEQLRRRLDDPKGEAEEREGLKKHAEQLEYDGRESHRSQRPQTPAGSPSAEVGPSSRSDAGPFTLQVGPSTSSNDPLDGQPSTSTQCNLDSFQATARTHEQRKETTLSDPMSHTTHLHNAVRAPHHHDAQRDNIRAGSTAYTTADDGDLQRVNLQLQEQNEQLRRQLGDMERKAEAERYMLEKEVAELRSCGHECHKSQAHHLPSGSPGPSSQAERSGSSNTGASIHLTGPSTFSNLPPEGRRSSSPLSNSDSIEGGEKANEEESSAYAEK